MRSSGRRLYLCAALPALLGLALLATAQAPAPKPARPPDQERHLFSLDVPHADPTELPEQCQRTREHTDQWRAELDASLPAQAKTAAAQYVAKPGPGEDEVKAWGNYAAAALLAGDSGVAAWAGLKAVELRWDGETVTNAGIHLYHLGKTQEALELLNCAYEMGYRSPYLFEALAVIHQSQGNNAQARRAISQAQEAAPDDLLIETEASFINTGQPPAPRPPERDPDGLDSALRELDEHAQAALNRIKAQVDEIDHAVHNAGAEKFYQIEVEHFTNQIKNARDQARQARATDSPQLRGAAPAMRDAVRQMMINNALATCVSVYAIISDTLLTFPDTIEGEGSPLLFWAEVLGLDPRTLAGENPEAVSDWLMHPEAKLAQRAADEYRRDKEAAYQEHNQRDRACRDNPCKIREGGRWCGVWKQLYERWQNAGRQRHNTAARHFDRIATRKTIEAENEYLQLRDYAVRQLKKMRFPKALGTNLEEMTLQGINMTIRPVYDRHLNPSSDSMGTVAYLRGQALWFQGERSTLDEALGHEANEVQETCEPALRALLELLAEEEWQAYLDHLKDRLAWDIQPKTESGDCPPGTASIGPMSISTDLANLGQGKFDVKWEKGPFTASGSVTAGGSGGLQFAGNASAKVRGVTIGVNSAGDSSVSRSVSYGPFKGKGKATLTSAVNPYNSREYLGIKLTGSAGFGLGSKKLGASWDCYPSSGSVTFYPRAFYEDAVKYMSTPRTRPAGGRSQ